MRYRVMSAAFVFLVFVLAPSAATAQTPAAPSSSTSTGRVGVAVQASTLGLGGDIALKLSPKANIRAGMNTLSHTRDFDDDDGNVYTVKGKVKSMHAFLDWFPWGGAFHLSPGFVFANDTEATLSSTITAGRKIEIGDIEYVSSSTNPIKASGAVTVKSSAFAVTMGWGNIVPSARRFSVPFEIGVVFQGAPTATIAFTGLACSTNGSNCRDIATDATIQAEVRKQNTELNDDLNKPYFKFFPVLSLGLAIRF